MINKRAAKATAIYCLKRLFQFIIITIFLCALCVGFLSLVGWLIKNYYELSLMVLLILTTLYLFWMVGDFIYCKYQDNVKRFKDE